MKFGQHLLVSRMLKGAFNVKPCTLIQVFYFLRDIRIVVQFLKQLRKNKLLSLHLLTIKSVMLLALARASRSMDLLSWISVPIHFLHQS